MTPADKLYEWLRKEKANVMRYIYDYAPQKIPFEDETNMGEDRSKNEKWAIYPSDLPLKYARTFYILAAIEIDTSGNICFIEFPDFTMVRKEEKPNSSLDWELLRDMIKKVLEG